MRKEHCFSWNPSNVLQEQKKAWMRYAASPSEDSFMVTAKNIITAVLV